LILLSFLISGCASSQKSLNINLRPAWIGLLFSDNSPLASYLDERNREWLSASAYYIYKKHEAPSTNVSINRFLANQFGDDFKLSFPLPLEISPNNFQLKLRSGATLDVLVTSEYLILNSEDRDFNAALIGGIYGKEGLVSDNRITDEMRITHGLIELILRR
jgi:hypothetical protein